jgi:Cu2+-exporting ATPase
VHFYGGGVFLKSAYRELKAKLPGMMTLIAIAITAAYAYSVYTTFTGGMNLFWELATLIAIMLIGHYIEMRAVQGAKGALKELAKLLPDTAEVIREGKTLTIPVRELAGADVVLVRPGAKVPADGEIIEGRSELNEAIITGESKPVSKNVGDQVIAGSLNGDASITVRVTNVGEKTFLAGIMRLVADAEASKSRLQMLSDRAAFWLTILAVGSALTTLIVWLWLGMGASFAIERVVAVATGQGVVGAVAGEDIVEGVAGAVDVE